MSTIMPKSGKCPKGTKKVTFKRAKKGGKLLAKTEQVTMCLREKGGHRKPPPKGKRCRAGGRDWKEAVRQNIAALPKKPTKAQRRAALKPAMYEPCE